MPVTGKEHQKIFPFDPRKSLLEIKHIESESLAATNSYWNSIKVTLYREDFSIFGFAFMKFFKRDGKLEGEIRIGRIDFRKINSVDVIEDVDYFCYDYREEISVFPYPVVFNFKSPLQIVLYEKENDTAIPVKYILAGGNRKVLCIMVSL